MPVEAVPEECREAMRLKQFSHRTVQPYLPVRRRSRGCARSGRKLAGSRYASTPALRER